MLRFVKSKKCRAISWVVHLGGVTIAPFVAIEIPGNSTRNDEEPKKSPDAKNDGIVKSQSRNITFCKKQSVMLRIKRQRARGLYENDKNHLAPGDAPFIQ